MVFIEVDWQLDTILMLYVCVCGKDCAVSGGGGGKGKKGKKIKLKFRI